MAKPIKTKQSTKELKDSLDNLNKEIKDLFDALSLEQREITANEKKRIDTLKKEVETIKLELEVITKEQNKLVKVKFLKSPTGVYYLGYNISDETKVKSFIAEKMFADGTAKKV